MKNYKEMTKAELIKELETVQSSSELVDEMKRTIHELEVYKIELEMQNRELQEAQQELEISRHKYTDLFDFAPVGYFIHNNNGIINEINITGAKHLGFERSRLLDNPFRLYIEDSDKQIFYEHLLKCKKSNKEIATELYLKRKNDEIFYVKLITVPVQIEEGIIYRTAIIDITERKRVEEDLKKSQRLLAETGMMGKVGGWEFNIDTKKQTWTEETYNIHEVDITYDPTVEEGINFYTPASRPIIERAFQQAIEHGEPYDLELEIITARGNLRSVHTIGKADLEHRRIYGFFQDITSRKQVEEALRESEQKFKQLVKLAPLPMAILDKYGVMNYFNERFTSVFGYTLDDIPTIEEWWQLACPDENYRQWVMKTWEAAVSSSLHKASDIEPIEYNVTCKNGELRVVVISGIPIDKNFLVTLIDITERKNVEKLLRNYSSQLEETVRERTKELKHSQEKLIRQEKLAILGLLAGGVGHELRNPLGVISNAIYFLQMTLSDADETTKEYLEIISSGVHRSNKIISDLLDFARIKSVEKEDIEVSALISEVLKNHPPPEKIKITTTIASEQTSVFIDTQKIHQVLLNLITNAYQAMPEGGNIIINTKVEKDQVKLSITDTGCGISQENLPKIFEPLFSTKITGIGLGLAVSKNLVEINGGEITVESTEGKGTTFTVILPTREESL